MRLGSLIYFLFSSTNVCKQKALRIPINEFMLHLLRSMPFATSRHFYPEKIIGEGSLA